MIQVIVDEQGEENKIPTKEQNIHEINEINEDTVRLKNDNEKNFDEPYLQVGFNFVINLLFTCLQ